MQDERHTLTVKEGATGRIDRYVAETLELSRTRVQRLLREGRITVGGHAVKKSDTVEPGLTVEVLVPAAEPVEIEAEDLPLDIVYEDEALVVVNKAAGMVVHPAPGHRSGTLVNALLHHIRDLSGVGGRLRPGIVHRLDRDTSGLLVVAKTDATHRSLSASLKLRQIKRLYKAATWGHLPESPVTIDAPIGRDPKDRKRMAVIEAGRPALTRVRVLERWLRAELLEVALKTGRTHQVRVHMMHVGHPIVGDAVYGLGWVRGMGGPSRRWADELDRRTRRQFLHAAELAFDHPVTGERMIFEADLPPDLAEVAAWARSPG